MLGLDSGEDALGLERSGLKRVCQLARLRFYTLVSVLALCQSAE
jgi:hypothetical protein